MSTQDDTIPSDLLHICLAVRLIPGSKPGRTLHCGTLKRWIDEGKVRGWKIGGRIHVSRAELLALVRPVQPRRPRAVPEPTRAQQAALTKAILQRHGLA